MSQQHGAGQEHRCRVGLVLALDIQADVSTARLEDGHVAAHVAPRHYARATDQRCADVRQDTPVQVRHDHDVELLRSSDGLHGRVVDDHVARLERRVLLRHLLERVPEQAVGQFHDVRLVDARDLLAMVRQGKAECELGDPLRFGPGDDLQRLHHPGHRLMLESRVFALGVLADDAHIDVVVPGLVPGNVLDQNDRRVNVQLLP